MSKTAKLTARLVIRRCGGIKSCKRMVLDESLEPATRAFLEETLKRYAASEKRRKAREARKIKPRFTGPVVEDTRGGSVRLCAEDKRKPRGFVDPLLTRDGVTAPVPRQKRKSPRQPFSSWRTRTGITQ
jgi:hypothetical protein